MWNILKKCFLRRSLSSQRSELNAYSKIYIREGVIIMLHTVLWGIVILLLVIGLLGFFFRLAGGIIRILIAIAGIIIILNLLGYLFHWF
jgi:hypothetical protein